MPSLIAQPIRPGVLVLAATNRPAAVDGALLRPGRFDMLLYVPPPNREGRLQTLEVHTRSMPLDADVDLTAIAAATTLYTGAVCFREGSRLSTDSLCCRIYTITRCAASSISDNLAVQLSQDLLSVFLEPATLHSLVVNS